jgi:large subunit ribosomal protein L23
MAVFGKTTKEEKSATALLETPKAENRYVFEVNDSASKPQIKRAVESVYGVHVVSVNTVSLPSRVRRFGRTMGRKSGVKKAMVEIKEGESLVLFQAGM